MDTFAEFARKMEGMPPEARDEETMKHRSLCICPGCPSYSPCMKEKGELLYCIGGKSRCTIGMTGCICPTCPVTGLLGLTHAYYCARGAEDHLRKR